MSDKDNSLLAMRHSLAHIMANAIQHLWPDAKFGVGPVVENGFYYDVDSESISIDDLQTIEKEMKRIIAADEPFEQFDLSFSDAVQWATLNNQPYKVELLNDLAREGTTRATELDSSMLGIAPDTDSKVKTVSFYRNGDFTDLCRGPHVTSTGNVGAFKLTRVSGAYWRGDPNKKQMQRIYGIAFKSEAELKSFIADIADAKQRDHRKLGQELDLFVFSELVGAGLPLYTPRGTVLIEELKNSLREISRAYDMQPVSIPHLAKRELYEVSGHAIKFADELFSVKSHYDQEFILKPVNCPHHTQIYASRPRSYRELPLRYVEQTMQYRDEKPGQIGGLQRTRGFTVDDGHTFCRLDQVEEEVATIIQIIKEFYSRLGLWGKHWVSLSLRDISRPDDYIGDLRDWDTAEDMLDRAAQKHDLNAKRMNGEAALYGPKLDFMFRDALGRETQLATIQLDFAMPSRFNLVYADKLGKNQTPVMIHRAILGSFERFLMLLIEHFGGKFPVWLSPEQVRLVTVNQEKEIIDRARNISMQARKLGIRSTVDDSNESVGKKIRASELMKVPYTVVIGEKEVDGSELSVRIRKDLDVKQRQKTYRPDEFLQAVSNEVADKTMQSSL